MQQDPTPADRAGGDRRRAPLDENLESEIGQAIRRDPRDFSRIVTCVALYFAALLVYLLVEAVSAHNPLATQFLYGIGANGWAMITMGIGILLPSPLVKAKS